MRQGDYDYEFGSDMSVASYHCSRFSRRHDFDIFNMGTYQSCENCRHMGSDGECIAKMSGMPMRQE